MLTQENAVQSLKSTQKPRNYTLRSSILDITTYILPDNGLPYTKGSKEFHGHFPIIPL